jgi:peroxiredoxin family protein
MGVRTLFLVTTGEPERVARAAVWALTAASVGEEVRVLLAAPALRACAPGGPMDGPVLAGMPPVRELWGEVRALGGRVVACTTEVAWSGLRPEALEGWLDDIVSLPSFWRESADFRVVAL